jgi:hypothetical protein
MGKPVSELRSDIYDHPDMGGRFQFLLPAGYLLQVFPLNLLLLGLDLMAYVNGFSGLRLEVGKSP